jgi:hypothetical protein
MVTDLAVEAAEAAKAEAHEAALASMLDGGPPYWKDRGRGRERHGHRRMAR